MALHQQSVLKLYRRKYSEWQNFKTFQGVTSEVKLVFFFSEVGLFRMAAYGSGSVC